MDGSKNPPGEASASQALYRPSQEDRILNLMRPLRTDEAELAPDGKHLAFVEADPYRVQLIIIDLDHPEAKASADVGRGDWWQRLAGTNWSSPRVVFLRWATAKRLIFADATNGIFAVNADGSGLTKLVTSQDVGIRKGKDLSILAQSAPPGMAIAPNQLDLMPGSPPTNLDPAFTSANRSNTSGFGMINGQAATAGASSYNYEMADPKSNAYINSTGGPDRATDPAAVLETPGSRSDMPDELVPRVARIAAMPPDDPEHIIVEASGAQDPLSGLYYYGLYRVDIEDGTRVSLGEGKLPGHEVLYDQAGHLRIVLDAIGRNYFHVFPGKALWRGAKALNQSVRDPAQRGFQAKPETFFAAHAIPIGFDFDPDILYYASNLGRDTMGLYSLNLKSGDRTNFAVESPDADVVDPMAAGDPAGPRLADDPLVFDGYRRELAGVRLAGPIPSTRWLDPEIAQIQARIDRRFLGRTAELLQWDEHRTRFLVLVTGLTDPGRYYIFTPASDQILLCVRRAPWIAGDNICLSVPVSFASADGTGLTGSLTLARNARIHPPPLVVLCPDGPGQPLPAVFDRDAQAFAWMGYTVLRVNYRGVGGLGLRRLGAIRSGVDRVPLDDILAAIDSVSRQTPIDPSRIAVVGEGLGGYIALRSVQVHPERFRSAVAIDAPVDLGQWVREPGLLANTKERNNSRAAFQTIIAEENQGNPLLTLDALHATVNQPLPAPPEEDPPDLFIAKARLAFFSADRRDWAAISPDRFPQDVMRPICMIVDATGDPAYVESAKGLRNAIERRGGQVDFLAVNGRFSGMDPKGHAKVLSQVNEFLNLDFYTYNVEIGQTKIIH
jgi:pimeloyl-ACP methyl ester carboxylesterase